MFFPIVVSDWEHFTRAEIKEFKQEVGEAHYYDLGDDQLMVCYMDDFEPDSAIKRHALKCHEHGATYALIAPSDNWDGF